MGTDSKPFIYSTESKLTTIYNSNTAHFYAYEGQNWVSPLMTCQQKGNQPMIFYSIIEKTTNADLKTVIGYEVTPGSNLLNFKFKLNPMVYKSNMVEFTVRCGVLSQPTATDCFSSTCVEQKFLLYIDKVMSLQGLTTLTFYTNSINSKEFKLVEGNAVLENNRIFLVGTVQANKVRFSKPYKVGSDTYVKITSVEYTAAEPLCTVQYKTMDLGISYRTFTLSFQFK